MEQTTDQNQNISKLKKWGWWAVGGLAAVLVIAGLIVAIITSGPKPTEPVAADETSEQPEQPEPEAEKNNEDQPETQTNTPEEDLPVITATPSTDLPKTGPEDPILPIISAGLIGYLIAFSLGTIRRR